jgi:HAD superfamily hydrolase (TIGR01509 family)
MFNDPHGGTSAPRVALFDVDGTLVDTNGLHAEAWRVTFAHFGHDIPAQAIAEQIGKGGDNLIPALLPDASDAEAEEMDSFRGELFKRDYLPRATPFPGVRELFERLVAEGVKIVLASSSSRAEVDYHLNLIGCSDLVSAVTTKDDVENSKPCPDIFAAALEKVAPIPASQAIVIGDTPWDMIAAGKLGLATIGVRSGGFSDAQLRDSGAGALFDGPADLLARFDQSPFGARAHAEA